MTETELLDDARFLATIDLIRRTGATEFQIRYHDDEQPVVWMAVAGTKDGWEVDAALNPLKAVWRLVERLVDGGMCRHCSRPAGVSDNWESGMPLSDVICWYIYDPELKTFRRSCEGDR